MRLIEFDKKKLDNGRSYINYWTFLCVLKIHRIHSECQTYKQNTLMQKTQQKNQTSLVDRKLIYKL